MDSLQAAQVVVGVALAVGGLVVVVSGRKRLSRQTGASAGAWIRMGCGSALLGVGYHLAGWGLPASWVPLKAPVEYWWIVVLAGAFVALGGWRLEASESQGGRGGG